MPQTTLSMRSGAAELGRQLRSRVGRLCRRLRRYGPGVSQRFTLGNLLVQRIGKWHVGIDQRFVADLGAAEAHDCVQPGLRSLRDGVGRQFRFVAEFRAPDAQRQSPQRAGSAARAGGPGVGGLALK